jgi:hypothetical protein
MPEEKKPKLELRALKRPSPPKSKPPSQEEAPTPEGEVSEAKGEVPKPQDEAPKSRDEVPPPKSEAPEAKGEDKPQGKPKPNRLPPLPRPEVATNASGEEFRQGDLILTRAPWLHRESRVDAKVVGFYQGETGQTWAEYQIVGEIPDRWGDGRGLMRAELLERG